MTQKELLYLEDAIGHEQSILKILESFEGRLEDKSISKYINSEMAKHKKTLNKLMNFMEDISNEW